MKRLKAYKMNKAVLCLLSVVLLLTGCATSEQIRYFQDIDYARLDNMSTQYEAVIKKDDLLSIVVSGPDKSVVAPYNLTLSETVNGSGITGNPEQNTLNYLVNAEGNISFPTLGTIHVEGMTRKQLVDYLTEKISADVKDPIVYVAFKNFKITVLGEVNNPGTFTVESEKINVLQALGRAGDLKLTAERDGILLLREVDGTLFHYKIDLRQSFILNSPFYYLQQNDVLVVPPSPVRVANATLPTGLLSSTFSFITTVIALITFLK